MEHKRPLQSISDDELLRRLAELLGQSRRVEADLVAHIGEVDERRLYAREASPSMFAYCTEALHLSEAEAYLRIATARAVLKHPLLLTMLSDGRLHLTGIAKLAPHLTRENRDTLLKRATHRSKREIEELIAELAPKPDAPAVMRKLPEKRPEAPSVVAPSLRPDGVEPSLELRLDGVATPEHGEYQDEAATHSELRLDGGGSSPAPGSGERAVVQPLSPARYKVQFTASAELHDKLERLRALMRSGVPDGDLALIIEQAVTEKLERLEAKRYARTSAPRKGLAESDTSPSSRHLPAAVRRAVHERDGNRCRYLDKGGRRCSERHRLEFHHRHPYGLGGDHALQNILLMCHAHNRYLAEHDYGRLTTGRYRSPGNRIHEAAAVYSAVVYSTGSTLNAAVAPPPGNITRALRTRRLPPATGGQADHNRSLSLPTKLNVSTRTPTRTA